VLFGEPVSPLTLSLGGTPATLGVHVGHVVGVGSDEKVVGIHARPNVARVTNEQAIRDRADVHLGGEAVRVHNGSADATAEDAVSANGGSGPKPAPVVPGLINVKPEALFNWSRLFGHGARCLIPEV
jgi:hypothetical protein